jgi:hypothetical protein
LFAPFQNPLLRPPIQSCLWNALNENQICHAEDVSKDQGTIW